MRTVAKSPPCPLTTFLGIWLEVSADLATFLPTRNTCAATADEAERIVGYGPADRLSTVVAAELRAGITGVREVRKLEQTVLRRIRSGDPSSSGAAWKALGATLAWLIEHEGLELQAVRRSSIFDILLAYSCRENGAILVSGNTRDLRRIAQVFAFDFVKPYPQV